LFNAYRGEVLRVVSIQRVRSLWKPTPTENITMPTSRLNVSEKKPAKMPRTMNPVTGFSSDANGISGAIAAIIAAWQKSETNNQYVERC